MGVNADCVGRGQSDVIGVVLLLAVVVAGTIAIVGIGSSVLSDGRSDAQIESAEHAMTKFDATAALIALGKSDSQRAVVSVNAIGESIEVQPDDGWMRVKIINNTSGETVVLNRTLGAVVYKNDGVEIAYQGGGVWKQVSGSSTMVSPPEFHYRGRTLTLPLITVKGGSVNDGDIVLTNTGDQLRKYPNDSASPPLLNPLEDGQVNVTVHSEYYEAWGRFFEQRTSGIVHYDHPNESVTIELVIPLRGEFENPLISTDPGGVVINGGNSELYSTGGNYPSADGKIEEKIAECESGGCVNISSAQTLSNSTTYYHDGDIGGDWTFDTSSGDMTLVVNGSFTPSTVDILGDNRVNVYVRQNFKPDGGADLNTHDSASQFWVYVHSDGTVTMKGSVGMHGVVYAPESHVDFDGKTHFVGSLIGETITVNGEPSNEEINSDPDLAGSVIGLESGGSDAITYLYVSVTNVTVSSTG